MRDYSITRLAIGALALLTATGCHHSDDDAKRATAVANTTEEAKATIAAISAAYNAHDAVKLASHDAPDYVSMFHGFATAIGPAADIASVNDQFKDPAAKFHLTIRDIDVARSGEMAVVRTTYLYDFTDPKTNFVARESGNWLIGLKRQPDGSLKMTWSIGADEPQTASAANSAP
ncbi:MAG: nuclear transport factor 2 family protein [Casimicrobiaceae bacterium]